MSNFKTQLPVVTLIQKEYLTLRMVLKTAAGVAVDVSAATLQLTIKEEKDSTDYDITVADASFDKTLGATGIITCPITSTNLDITGEYYGLLKITFSATNIKKAYFRIKVEASEE